MPRLAFFIPFFVALYPRSESGDKTESCNALVQTGFRVGPGDYTLCYQYEEMSPMVRQRIANPSGRWRNLGVRVSLSSPMVEILSGLQYPVPKTGGHRDVSWEFKPPLHPHLNTPRFSNNFTEKRGLLYSGRLALQQFPEYSLNPGILEKAQIGKQNFYIRFSFEHRFSTRLT